MSETAVILEGDLGPLEGSMKPLTLMASEDGDGEPENWQQKKRSCVYGDGQSTLSVLLLCGLPPVCPGQVWLSRQDCKCKCRMIQVFIGSPEGDSGISPYPVGLEGCLGAVMCLSALARN